MRKCSASFRGARTPGWFIKVEEFTNGGWRVKARDRWGREFEQTGGDSDVPRMTEEAERYAESVAAELAKNSK
jgi:hypothetical protein